jgi:hypothetical protein
MGSMVVCWCSWPRVVAREEAAARTSPVRPAAERLRKRLRERSATDDASESVSASTSADSGVDTATDDASDDRARTTHRADATQCMDDCVCVRAGATGSGADWADALPELPGRSSALRLLRRSGQLRGRDDRRPRGRHRQIHVLRATEGDHGTDVGWSRARRGLAEFGPIVLAAPFVGSLATARCASSARWRAPSSTSGRGRQLRGCDLDNNFRSGATSRPMARARD